MGIEIGNWRLGIETEDRYWALRIGDLGLGIEMGDLDLGFRLGLGIRDRDLALRFVARIGDGNCGFKLWI